jgi:hypothetical protein
MAIRYSDTPQVTYGRQRPADNNWRERFPQNAQPIRSAPKNSAEPFWVFEPDGSGFLAVHHNGNFQKLYEERDDRTGKTSIRMLGQTVANAQMWCPAQKR